MRYLRLILLPLSPAYLVAVCIRHLLYSLKILKSYSVPCCVISVGNRTAGGTGKTPFCILLTELFLSQGKKVCIISRGYKRTSSGLIVGFNGEKSDSIENTGDELMMIIERFREFRNRFFVLADSDRIRAADYAVNNFKPDIIILDDAFQHLRIKRDVDIIINDSDSDILQDKILLPAGNLREPEFLSGRANLIINNYKFSGLSSGSHDENNVLDSYYVSEGFYGINNNTPDLSCIKSAVIFSGIAKNESFISFVKKHLNVNIKAEISFPDHHDYSNDDIRNLILHNEENTIFLTTEKDYVKLRKFTDFLDNFEVYYLKINLKTDEKYLLKAINAFNNI